MSNTEIWYRKHETTKRQLHQSWYNVEQHNKWGTSPSMWHRISTASSPLLLITQRRKYTWWRGRQRPSNYPRPRLRQLRDKAILPTNPIVPVSGADITTLLLKNWNIRKKRWNWSQRPSKNKLSKFILRFLTSSIKWGFSLVISNCTTRAFLVFLENLLWITLSHILETSFFRIFFQAR